MHPPTRSSQRILEPIEISIAEHRQLRTAAARVEDRRRSENGLWQPQQGQPGVKLVLKYRVISLWIIFIILRRVEFNYPGRFVCYTPAIPYRTVPYRTLPYPTVPYRT